MPGVAVERFDERGAAPRLDVAPELLKEYGEFVLGGGGDAGGQGLEDGAEGGFGQEVAGGVGGPGFRPGGVGAGRPRLLAGNGPPGAEFVVVDLRLPRALDGLLVGFAMGMAGAVFQSLSRNPLGSPDIIGFGSGASAGALVAIIVLDAGAPQTALDAVCGGFATAAAVYLLAWKRGVHGYRLVLVGIGVSAVIGSVTSYLYVRAEIGKAAQAATWMIGSLNGRGWSDVRIAAVGLVLLVPVVLAHVRRLTLLEMGDDSASALGIHPERTRLTLLAAGTGLTAMAVAASGPIPFVALAAPQLARRITRFPGPNVLPAAWLGAALVATADWATQRISGSAILPVGVVTGVVGGIHLAWLLLRERRSGRL
ncbi:iron chelate uptake ABC transporter family permease subunit [Streptomyces sp. NPDC046465]|uniref:FecCD family ABC transporter permease n=1 Tax=Streptomyces sp. NPDC046465 TaxID=3155810 RepID=UPI0033D32289